MLVIDLDVWFGWKSNMKLFFGYKEYIVMMEEEIIIVLKVIGGSLDDGK